MRISQIKINHFGKLKDFALNLDEGFTIIYGENEAGKSTIMAFIRMMFYGTVNRTNDLSKNLRKRYAPWDGTKMSGAIEFFHEGQEFRLEKTFGATPTTDVVKLWNQSTNKEECLNEQKEVGKRFLGLGETAFEKSVFIGQIGSVIQQEKDKENEIIQKLQNLVSSGDENSSFDVIEARLTTAIEKINARGGKIGLLDRLKQENILLENQKAEAIICDNEKIKMQISYEDIIVKRDMLKADLMLKQKEIDELQEFKEYEELAKILTKNKIIQDFQKDLDIANESLIKGEFQVSLSFIDQSQSMLLELGQEEIRLQTKKEEISEKESILQSIKNNEAQSISKEQFDNINNMYNDVAALKVQIKDLQTNLQKNEYLLKDFLANQEINNIKQNKIQEYKDKLSKMTKEFEANNKNHNININSSNNSINNNNNNNSNNNSNSNNSNSNNSSNSDNSSNSNKPLTNTNIKNSINKKSKIAYILLALLSLTMLLLAVIVNPGFLAVVVLAAIGAIAIWRDNSKQIKVDLEESSQLDKIMQERKINYEANREFLERELQDLQKSKPDYIDYSTEEFSSDELSFEISQIKSEITQHSAEMVEKQQSVAQQLELFNVEGIEELQQKYIHAQNTINRIEGIISEIREKSSQYLNFSKELESKKDELFQSISQLKRVNSLQAAKDLLDNIAGTFQEAQTQKYLLDMKKKELRDDLNARTISMVREDYESRKELYEKNKSLSNEFDEKNKIAINEISKEEFAQKTKNIDLLKINIGKYEIEIAKTESEMMHAFVEKPELSIVEDKIKQNFQKLENLQRQLDALKFSKTQLEQAFLEMQQTFGPIVNARTGLIFSKLTGGKYQDLLVSRDLTISVREPLMQCTQDWQYFSNGTIDQVYFSLRFAISEFLADQTGGLPLFIDDAFLQYDDARTKQGLVFLEDYVKTKQTQIMFFSCHKNMTLLCNRDTRIITLD